MIKAFFKAIEKFFDREKKALEKEPSPRIDADASRAVELDSYGFKYQMLYETYDDFKRTQDFKAASNYITSFIYTKPAPQLNSDTEPTTPAQAQAPGADVAPDENAPSSDDKAISNEVIKMARTLGFVEQKQPETEPEPQAELSTESPAPVQTPTTQESPKVDAAQIGETEPTTPAPAQARAQGVENVEKSTVDEQKSFTDSFRFDDSSILESTTQAPKTRKKPRQKTTIKNDESPAPQEPPKVDTAQIEPQKTPAPAETLPNESPAPAESAEILRFKKLVNNYNDKLERAKKLGISEKEFHERIQEILKTSKKNSKEDKKMEYLLTDIGINIFLNERERKLEKAEQEKKEQQQQQPKKVKGLGKIPNAQGELVRSSNSLTRSDFFTAKTESKLALVENKLCYSEKGIEIIQESGRELCVFDEHIINVLLKIGLEKEKETDLFGEESFCTTSYEILKKTGRDVNDSKTYRKIERSIRRIGKCVFTYKATRNDQSILSNELLLYWQNAKITGEGNEGWKIRFNPKLFPLYEKNFTFVNLISQAKLLKSPIASKLFYYFLSQDDGIQDRFLATLQSICGLADYYNPIEFKKRLKKALPVIAKEFKLLGGCFDYGEMENEKLGIFPTGERDNNGHKIEKLVFFKKGNYEPETFVSLAEQEHKRLLGKKSQNDELLGENSQKGELLGESSQNDELLGKNS